MDRAYHAAIVQAQFMALEARARAEWPEVTAERDESLVYAGLSGRTSGERYLARIDMARYPVEPYWIGFLDPDLPREERRRVSDTDPRYWPWSPMPGLHGSFNLTFPGPYRTFWCRPCTVPYFHYHGQEAGWESARWSLDRVVAHLREAVRLAEHPSRWRVVQQPTILQVAAQLGVELPPNAGLGHA